MIYWVDNFHIIQLIFSRDLQQIYTWYFMGWFIFSFTFLLSADTLPMFRLSDGNKFCFTLFLGYFYTWFIETQWRYCSRFLVLIYYIQWQYSVTNWFTIGYWFVIDFCDSWNNLITFSLSFLRNFLQTGDPAFNLFGNRKL